MLAKIHRKRISNGEDEAFREILALCDSELLGKVFEEKELILDLKTYHSFYDGEKVNEKKAIELLKNATNINIVGKRSVETAKKALKINAEGVKKIKGIPHLQIYRV